MDLFTPAWKSKDIAKREAALKSMNDTELSEIVNNQTVALDIRMRAIELIQSDSKLLSCVKHNVENSEFIAHIIDAFRSLDTLQIIKYSNDLATQFHQGAFDMKTVIKNVKRQDILNYLVVKKEYSDVAFEAMQRLDQEHLMQAIKALKEKISECMAHALTQPNAFSWIRRIQDSFYVNNLNTAYKALGDIYRTKGDEHNAMLQYALSGDHGIIAKSVVDRQILSEIACDRTAEVDARLIALKKLFPDITNLDDVKMILLGEPITREDDLENGWNIRANIAKRLINAIQAQPEMYLPIWDDLCDMVGGERYKVKAYERFGGTDSDQPYDFYKLRGCGLAFPQKPKEMDV